VPYAKLCLELKLVTDYASMTLVRAFSFEDKDLRTSENVLEVVRFHQQKVKEDQNSTYFIGAIWTH